MAAQTNPTVEGLPTDAGSLAEVLDAYASAGYGEHHWATEDGEFRCGRCGRTARPETVRLESLRRLEGVSDPDDMVAVVAAECPHCAARGTLTLTYGPMASPGDSALLTAASDQRGQGGLPRAMAPGEDTPAGRRPAAASEGADAPIGEQAGLTVLVALDESEASQRAAAVARRLFPQPETRFVALNVAQLPIPWMGAGAGFGAGLVMTPETWAAFDRDMPAEQVADLAEAGGLADAETVSEAGDPVERICQVADEHDADVIVVGSRERGWLDRLFERSVSAGVVKESRRPVLVAPHDTAQDTAHDTAQDGDGDGDRRRA
ncbi:MAG: universal stress protein [Acidimicrobiales bacterium]